MTIVGHAAQDAVFRQHVVQPLSEANMSCNLVSLDGGTSQVSRGSAKHCQGASSI